MKKNFYLAMAACLFAILITSILVIDNKFDILSSVKSKDGYVNLDKDFTEKPIETIPTVTGQDNSLGLAEAEKSSENEKQEETKKEVISFAWPVKGELSVKYSPDKVVYDKFLDEYSTSDGVTLSANKNDNVSSAEKGKVAKISEGLTGKVIEIEHEDGYKTTYSNVCDVKVEEEEYVQKGDIIGKVNLIDEKYSILGFEITKDGKSVDPAKLIK